MAVGEADKLTVGDAADENELRAAQIEIYWLTLTILAMALVNNEGKEKQFKKLQP
jgi:hypothetical protein